jgi:hypothetical protein
VREREGERHDSQLLIKRDSSRVNGLSLLPSVTRTPHSGEPYLKSDPITKTVTKIPNKKRLQREKSLVRAEE